MGPMPVKTSLAASPHQLYLFPFLYSIHHLTYVFFLNVLTVGYLPYPPQQDGTGNKRNTCAGCRNKFRAGSNVLTCHFALQGFPLNGSPAIPCLAQYHPGCFKVGAPFTTRLAHNKGLSWMTEANEVVPTIVCKCCTVRAVI